MKNQKALLYEIERIEQTLICELDGIVECGRLDVPVERGEQIFEWRWRRRLRRRRFRLRSH